MTLRAAAAAAPTRIVLLQPPLSVSALLVYIPGSLSKCEHRRDGYTFDEALACMSCGMTSSS